ncbi:hypothetical protein V2J63_00805 [Georgenia sp. MJ278]
MSRRDAGTPDARGGGARSRPQRPTGGTPAGPAPRSGPARAARGTRPAPATRPAGRPGGSGSPPSAAVYRRRRLVVLVLTVLAVAGIAWGAVSLVGALGGRDADAAPVADPTGEETEAAPAGDPQACAGDAVGVDLGVPSSTSAGRGLSIALGVTNEGEVPCLLDAGPAALVVTIASGEDEVWSSAHCAGEAERPLLLDAGATHETTVRWPGTRSAAGCPGDQAVAGAGTYRVTVATGARAAGPGSVFTIG